MNIPNILTIIRLFLIPLFVIVFYSNNSIAYAIFIFVLSGITDVLDGYIARKYNQITKIGIMLDPIADKLMLVTVLLCLSTKKYIPYWVPIVIIIKELTMICGGFLLYNKQDTVVPANPFGKLATFLFHISILILYFNYALGRYLLYASVIATLLAFFTYFINYLKVKEYKNKPR
ncbi:CDP-diacylglycerol--glycerol-3-phosphate 3-phosphatidyltransferase [Hathewaya histolytica]|uniref:CDP-diacylglycerol--glycerol-3-phosphate 3-phosphatidyltransferase n=1 Tax=Hathewaya histolytica TaxID=1498 RepID=A0A4U9RX04_HATHI|nr:CDP-diacylglycerol--glycerol-3-phosphate 3-phosphatidyltransferase [Hathewaya histolytica]VTQ96408.1 CDP-diacylglycerol--glycerol-3-phosphate 3-phosphatidyltransferase [Hathewaya histolytica]